MELIEATSECKLSTKLQNFHFFNDFEQYISSVMISGLLD